MESLADSVIYMSYYTISRLVNEGKIKPEDMSMEFCNYVFLGEGSPDGLCAGAKKARESFEYFYPVDSRHSGRDLVPKYNETPLEIIRYIPSFAKILHAHLR